MNKRAIGTQKEREAALYLEQNGMHITETNFRCRQGEIDIIGYEKEYLVFVEVKYRTGNQFGNGAEAVDRKKQRIICRVADYYRYMHGINEYQSVRYDVVVISGSEILWYQNAFMHIEHKTGERYYHGKNNS